MVLQSIRALQASHVLSSLDPGIDQLVCFLPSSLSAVPWFHLQPSHRKCGLPHSLHRRSMDSLTDLWKHHARLSMFLGLAILSEDLAQTPSNFRFIPDTFLRPFPHWAKDLSPFTCCSHGHHSTDHTLVTRSLTFLSSPVILESLLEERLHFLILDSWTPVEVAGILEVLHKCFLQWNKTKSLPFFHTCPSDSLVWSN